MKEGEAIYNSGDPQYDYNDAVLPSAVYFSARLIEDRLGVKILPSLEEE